MREPYLRGLAAEAGLACAPLDAPGGLADALTAAATQPLAPLTRRERRILVLLARRRSCACIARDLGLGAGALAELCTGMSRKLGMANLADLIRFAVARRDAVPHRSRHDGRSLP